MTARSPRRPDRFTTGALVWHSRLQGGPLPDSISGEEAEQIPLSARLAPSPGAAEAAAAELFHAARGGLPRGERYLAAAAVSRRNGCLFGAALQAGRAAGILRRRREVDLLLEEGVPSPLSGRAGALIEAAAALTATPPAPDRRRIWRLEEERLDSQEVADLILAAAFAHGESLIALALVEAVQPAPEG